MNFAISVRSDLNFDDPLLSKDITQNIKFFYDLLEVLGHTPYLMVFEDDAECFERKFLDTIYRSINFQQACRDQFDIAITFELGANIINEHRQQLRDLCHSKIVSVRYDNDLITGIEKSILGHNEIGEIIHIPDCDALWLSSHLTKGKSYFESLYRCEAECAPYLWGNDFIEHDFSEPLIVQTPNIYVMEPNVSVTNNAIIPLCIISALYQENPDIFDRAVILNGTHINQNHYFLNNIVGNLPGISSEEDKVYFSERAGFDDVFKRNDILLSHQWECELNYLYFEALFKGVSLVHNSPQIKDYGFYYPDFEIDLGIKALNKAIKKKFSKAQLKKNRAFLEEYSIHNPKVQKSYKQLINKVLNKRK